jgi:hypothetical protein
MQWCVNGRGRYSSELAHTRRANREAERRGVMIDVRTSQVVRLQFHAGCGTVPNRSRAPIEFGRFDLRVVFQPHQRLE